VSSYRVKVIGRAEVSEPAEKKLVCTFIDRPRRILKEFILFYI